jgi:hypothetical protein
MAAMSRRPALTLSALLLLLAPACAGTGTAPADAERPARTLQSTADLSPTRTFEIRFGSELAGFLIDVLPAPAGAPDQRAYEPGTALIQARDHTLLGFISPRGTTYRFDASGEARTVGFGSRSTSITAFFRKNDPPTLVPIEG